MENQLEFRKKEEIFEAGAVTSDSKGRLGVLLGIIKEIWDSLPHPWQTRICIFSYPPVF